MSSNSSADTEERIHRAALALFARKGFAATGIREVADHAGITSASLYHYMGTKEELLARILTQGHERILTTAATQLKAVEDPLLRLSCLVHVHVLAHTVRQTETAVMDAEVRSLPPTLAEPIIAMRDQYEALWSETLAEGSNRKCFDIAAPSLTRLALLSMCTGVTDWFVKGGPETMSEIAYHFTDLALGMVRAQQGGEYVRMHSNLVPDVAEIVMQLTQGWPAA